MKGIISYISLFIKIGGLPLLVMFYMFYVALYSPGVYEQTLLVVLIVVLKGVSKYLDKTAIWLLIFSISFVLIQLAHGKLQSMFSIFTIMFCPIVLYGYGKYLSLNLYNEKQLLDFWLLISLLVPLFLYGVVIKDISQNGFINITRNLSIFPDSQGDDMVLAATLYGVNVSLCFAGWAFVLIKDKSRRIITPLRRFAFIALAIMAIVTVMHLVSRTGIVISFAVLGVISFYKAKQRMGMLFFYIILIICAVLLIMSSSFFDQDIITAYSARQTGDVSDDIGGDRVWRWVESFPNMIMHPFGWAELKITKYEYVHNLWLDIARETGIIPFFCLMVVTVNSLRDTIKVFKIKDNVIAALLLAVFVAIIIPCMLEPIMNGAVYYFYIYCLFMGFQCGYIRRVQMAQQTSVEYGYFNIKNYKRKI